MPPIFASNVSQNVSSGSTGGHLSGHSGHFSLSFNHDSSGVSKKVIITAAQSTISCYASKSSGSSLASSTLKGAAVGGSDLAGKTNSTLMKRTLSNSVLDLSSSNKATVSDAFNIQAARYALYRAGSDCSLYNAKSDAESKSKSSPYRKLVIFLQFNF